MDGGCSGCALDDGRAFDHGVRMMKTEPYAPRGYSYDKKGNLIPEQMAGTGKPYAPSGYTYTKKGELKANDPNIP